MPVSVCAASNDSFFTSSLPVAGHHSKYASAAGIIDYRLGDSLFSNFSNWKVTGLKEVVQLLLQSQRMCFHKLGPFVKNIEELQ